METSPRIFKRLERVGRVYVGLRSCRVLEFTGISRCFRCQGFGHIGKYCKRQVACSRCGEEGHVVGRCKKNADMRKCANCVRAGLRNANHAVAWLGCPSLAIQRKRLKDRTEYE